MKTKTVSKCPETIGTRIYAVLLIAKFDFLILRFWELIKTSKESISINKSELIEDKTKTLVEKVFSDQENGINSQEEFNKDSVTPENFET